MADALLVLNAGSSSLKFSLFAARTLDVRLHGEFEGIGGSAYFRALDSRDTVLREKRWAEPLGHTEALEFLFDFLPGAAAYDRLAAVGHRVVHGGRDFPDPVLVDDDVLGHLENLVPLAPLHQPHSLAAIRAVASLDATLPQVACFDTSFHRFQPSVAQEFVLPHSITSRGVQHFGFHGLSYESIASVLPELDARAASGRTIVAHLDAGSSLCALACGRSVANSMDLAALDGDATERHIYRIGREIGSLAAALEGLDAVVFTGGIGEHRPAIRAGVCAAAAWLGLELDTDANRLGGPRISRESSRVAAWVIPADEEKMIAQHTMEALHPQ